MSDLEARARALHELIEPAVTAAGFDLVRVRLFERRDLTLQVMAEDPATGQMTIDDCADLSRQLSDLLDAADPIVDAYVLEVSSPGIDRPLTRAADYARWAGHEAKIVLRTAVAAGGRARRNFRGLLLGQSGDSVQLRLADSGDLSLPLADIQDAKLVLTDALIAETTAARAAPAPTQLAN